MKKHFILIFLVFIQSCSSFKSAEHVSTIDLIALDNPIVINELEELVQITDNRTRIDIQKIDLWHDAPVVRWNAVTRDWVIYYYKNPVDASRIYAIMSVAQQQALDYVASLDIEKENRLPSKLSSQIKAVDIGCNPIECGVLIGSAESILTYLFPDSLDLILNQVEEAHQSLLKSGNILPSDLDTAEAIGREIAERVIAERINDGSGKSNAPVALPIGDGIWKPDPFQVKPQAPYWGEVMPWLMESGDQFRPEPPPKFGSAEFISALDEVYEIQLLVTHEQLFIVDFWADNPGTFTPPGHWNLIASELIEKNNLSNLEASYVFATLNMAMMDAGIACWDAKYFYLTPRPWQVNTQIDGLVGQPNHPSYPSGHSCFSGAAAEVLSAFFVTQKEHINQMAKEASLSRLYGGIHYRFDIEAGLVLGEKIGKLYTEFAEKKGWVLISE